MLLEGHYLFCNTSKYFSEIVLSKELVIFYQLVLTCFFIKFSHSSETSLTREFLRDLRGSVMTKSDSLARNTLNDIVDIAGKIYIYN